MSLSESGNRTTPLNMVYFTVTSTSVIRVEGLHKQFGPTVALGGVDFEVHPGEVHALIGENGAGKSTLLKILTGLYQADRGRMWIEGEPYSPRGPQDARDHGISIVHQELCLAPHLTVRENIMLGSEETRWGFLRQQAMNARVRDALNQLEQSGLDPNALVAKLPMGAKQVVEIARALINHSKVLLLDEPTSSLTRADVQRLYRLVNRLRDQGLAIVYISHFLEEVKTLADRYTVLRDGCAVGRGEVSSTPIKEMVRSMVGRQIDQLYPRGEHKQGSALLEVKDLASLSKPTRVSMTLHCGEILGIFGLVGAGRTETLRTLFGLRPLSKGEIRFAEYRGAASPRGRLAQGMGLLSEDRKGEGLLLNQSIADNLTLTALDRFRSKWALPCWISPKQQTGTARTWIERMNVRCVGPRQEIGKLSGGNQQKVALARLLHHDVDAFLLDEPTRGIDVGSKAEIYKLLDRLAQDGKALLVVSSYLPELMGVSDRIAVMCRGVLGACRPVEAWTEEEIMLEATGSVSSMVSPQSDLPEERS